MKKNQISPMHLFEAINNCLFPEKVIIQVVIPVSLQICFFPLPPSLLHIHDKLSVDSPGLSVYLSENSIAQLNSQLNAMPGC